MPHHRTFDDNRHIRHHCRATTSTTFPPANVVGATISDITIERSMNMMMMMMMLFEQPNNRHRHNFLPQPQPPPQPQFSGTSYD